MSKEFHLEYPSRPFTTNQIYGSFSNHKRAAIVKEWREAFCLLAKEAKIPPLSRIQVYAWPVLRDRRVQDVGSCSPAVKSAIDGLVDAGVVPDDDPRYVTLIAFGPPAQEQGYDALRITIVEDPLD